MIDLNVLLQDLDAHTRIELSSDPMVVGKGKRLDIRNLPLVGRKWRQVTDAMAVFADLKNSTRISIHRNAASAASLYEAATGGIVRIFDAFEANYIAIQGDGALALFWGARRHERAICAGITVKTFSEDSLLPVLTWEWNYFPQTGLRVGIASSSLLVKRIGIPHSRSQEPVWAGHAVNYAVKAAQQADRHQLIITGAVWGWLSAGRHLALTCACAPPITLSWQDVTIHQIPDCDADRNGKMLKSRWCAIHGADLCAKMLVGRQARADLPKLSQELTIIAAEQADIARSRSHIPSRMSRYFESTIMLT